MVWLGIKHQVTYSRGEKRQVWHFRSWPDLDLFHICIIGVCMGGRAKFWCSSAFWFTFTVEKLHWWTLKGLCKLWSFHVTSDESTGWIIENGLHMIFPDFFDFFSGLAGVGPDSNKCRARESWQNWLTVPACHRHQTAIDCLWHWHLW